ncbi:MAG TPA: hypothetical protein DEB06_08295, partial [Phycisphaerales bacterium]|nr:hypothetical protein [Phycisphaerales bacterium]
MTVNSGAPGGELVTNYEYDDNGNLSRVSDPKGFITEYAFDFRGRQTLQRRWKGGSTHVLAQTESVFDADGNLVRMDERVIPEGGVELAALSATPVWTTIHEYDEINRRTRTVREAVQQVLDPQQRTADAPEDLLANPNFIVTEYGYDLLDNLTVMRKGEAASTVATGGVPATAAGPDPNNIVERTYDERNLVFTETRGGASADAVTTRFDYNMAGDIQARTEALGVAGLERTTRFAYDGFERLILTLLPDSTLHQVGAGATWEVGSSTPGGSFVSGYDDNSNRMKQTVTGPVPGSPTPVLLAHSEREYDALDRAISDKHRVLNGTTGLPTGAADIITRTEYNADSSVRASIDPRGNRTEYLYDQIGRLAELTLPDANGAAAGGVSRVLYEYDANGNTKKVTERDARADGAADDQFVTEYGYDDLDRLTSVLQRLDPDLQSIDPGNITRFEYDSRGHLVKAADPLNRVTVSEYDGLGRLTRTVRDMNGDGASATDPVDIVTTQTWDASSRLIAQTDDNGNATRYAYDSLDRLIITRYGDGTLDRVGTFGGWQQPAALRPDLTGFVSGYDQLGNAKMVRDANQSVITTTFDIRSRPQSRAIARGPSVLGTQSEQYTFDGLSRVLTARDDDTLVALSYDSLGRVLTETQDYSPTGAFPAAPKSVSYLYDPASNITRVTRPSGSTVDQTFDALNRIETVWFKPTPTDPSIEAALYKYDGPSRVANRSAAVGLTGTTRLETIYTYSGSLTNPVAGDRGFRRVRTIQSGRRGTFPVPHFQNIDKRTLIWDAAQNKLSATRTAPSASDQTRTYAYDRANRLTHSTRDAMPFADYDLDGVHNRLSVFGDLASGAQLGVYTMTAIDAAVNQYTDSPLHRLLYDNNGNLTRVDAQAAGGTMMSLSLGAGAGPQSVY